MSRISSSISTLVFVFIVGLMSACGQKGPLVQPADGEPAGQQEPESAKKAATR